MYACVQSRVLLITVLKTQPVWTKWRQCMLTRKHMQINHRTNKYKPTRMRGITLHISYKMKLKKKK